MEIITKTRFEKDIKKLKKRQKDFSKLSVVLGKLVTSEKLDIKYQNHPLVGNWRPCYELHIEPDWLLIYYIDTDNNQLILYRTGSHSDLF
ncbi:MAG: type II toxin-antitoxin system YafQ family toxin [Algicola sp.]|nr:type II toxin-antitoxin system YafQ family toxin [Algicola sp.]